MNKIREISFGWICSNPVCGQLGHDQIYFRRDERVREEVLREPREPREPRETVEKDRLSPAAAAVVVPDVTPPAGPPPPAVEAPRPQRQNSHSQNKKKESVRK